MKNGQAGFQIEIAPRRGQELLPWLIVLVGLVGMFVPTFVDLFNGLWSTDQNAHGPIVFAISIWFLIRRAKQIGRSGFEFRPAKASGWTLFAIGLALYVIGRSQSFLIFEVGSLVVLVVAIAFLLAGADVAKKLWFAFIFMLFIIPLPGSMIDSITQPMKIFASFAAEQLLYLLGFPVARSGVVISIGPYQLLVADACAGLNSLFTLEALGLLYMNLVRHESFFRNVLLAVLIVPISLASNAIRVVFLAVITYVYGDDAGQGFLHGFSGLILFLTALLLIMFVDSALRTIAASWRNQGQRNLAA
jgi:exosortase B